MTKFNKDFIISVISSMMIMYVGGFIIGTIAPLELSLNAASNIFFIFLMFLLTYEAIYDNRSKEMIKINYQFLLCTLALGAFLVSDTIVNMTITQLLIYLLFVTMIFLLFNYNRILNTIIIQLIILFIILGFSSAILTAAFVMAHLIQRVYKYQHINTELLKD